MDLKDIVRIITESFPFDIVSFDKEYPNEAYCIRKNPENKWEVYYAERGIKNDLKKYDSESDACKDLLQRMNSNKPLGKSSS